MQLAAILSVAWHNPNDGRKTGEETEAAESNNNEQDKTKCTNKNKSTNKKGEDKDGNSIFMQLWLHQGSRWA